MANDQRDVAPPYPNCNAVQSFAVVEEQELLAASRDDVARFDLLVVDQCSVRAAIPRATETQILIALVRVGSSVIELPAARSQTDMLLNANYDGVIYHGIERADVKTQQKFIKMLKSLRAAWKGKLFLFDSPSLFVSEPTLPSCLHGILLCNPLTDENGEPKLRSGPAYDLIARALREAQLQAQQRSEFLVLAWEKLSLRKDAVRPDTVPRFRKWASDQGVVPYFTYLGMHPMSLIPEEEGPIALLCNQFVAPLLAPSSSSAHPIQVSLQDDSPFAVVSQLFTENSTQSSAELLRAATTLLEDRPEAFAKAVAARLKSAAVNDVVNEVASLPVEIVQPKSKADDADDDDEIKDPRRALRRKLEGPQADEKKVRTELTMEDEAVLAGGQKELGVESDRESYWAVLRVQDRLREHGLLRNLLQHKPQELYRPSGNVSQPTLDPRIEAARATIKQHYSSATELRRLGFNKDEIERIQGELRLLSAAIDNYGTQEAPVQLEVYESDPVSLKQATFTLSEQCYLAVFQQSSDNCLRIYISRTHPNLAEGLVYCWLRAARLSHSSCLLVENIFAARQARSLPLASTSLISDRIYSQLLLASYRDLASFVQATPVSLQLAAQPPPSGLFAELVKQVQDMSVYRLTKEIDERQLKEKEDRATLAREVPRDELALLLLRAMWLESDRKELELLCHVLIRLPSSSLASSLRSTLLSLGRQTALTQLELSIRDANPFLVREVDLATIYLEFSGFTEDEANAIFGLTREQLGEILYNRIREKMRTENPSSKHLTDLDAKHYERTSRRARSIGLYLSKYMDGLFFLLPLLLNFLGVLYFNTGLYASTFIPPDQIPFVASGLLAAFVLTGGYITLIGRVCSLYTFQWSFSVALTWNVRLIAASMIAPSIAAVIVLAVWHSVPAILFALYVVLLSLNLLVIGSLYAMHMHSIWLSHEGHAILLGIGAHIALVATLVIGLDLSKHPSIVAFIHIGGVALATVIMIPCAFWLAHRRTTFASRIKLPNEMQVVAWYCARKRIAAPPLAASEDELIEWYRKHTEVKKPDSPAADVEPIEAPPVVRPKTVEALEAKKAAQSIAAASWAKYERMCAKFTSSWTFKLRRLLPFDVTLSLWHDRFVAERVCNSYEPEETLMRWYCLSMDKDRPRFATKEWNFNIVQAQAAMKMKTMTVDSHRGGLLYAWLRPWFVYGFLYYILLFLADLVAIFSGGFALSSFMPSKSIYATAKACSLIVLLLGCALLEPAIIRAARFRDERGPVLEKDSNIKSLARAARRRYLVRYLKELCIMICGLVIVIGIGAAIFYSAVHVKLDQPIDFSLLILYIGLVAAAAGFVLANLNVLFLPNRMFWVLVCGCASAAIGFAVGIVLYLVFSANWSVVAVLAASWLWYFSTLVLVIVESSGGAKYDLEHLFIPMQGPALQTSGQHWVSKPELPQVAQPKLTKLLLDHAKTTTPLARRSPIAAKVMSIFSHTLLSFHQEETKEEENNNEEGLKKSEREVADEKAKHDRDQQRRTLRAAFPKAEHMLQDAADEWIASRIEVYIVPESMLKLSEDYIYSAVAVRCDKSLKVFVASDKIDEKEQERTIALPRQIAEAILHEYCEQVLGWRHRDACLAELLLLDEGELVPARVALQLAATDDEGLIRLENSSFRLWLEELGYDISHAEEWENLASETRVALISHSMHLPADLSIFAWTSPSPVVSIEEKKKVASDGDEKKKEDDAQLLEPISPVAQQTSLLPVNDETAARAQLAMLFAQRVAKAGRRLRSMRRQNLLSPRSVATNAQWAKDSEVFAFAAKPLQDMRKWLVRDAENNATSASSVLRQCDTVLRLVFLASLGDPSFTSEWHHAVHASRPDGGVALFGQIVLAPFILLHCGVRLLTTFFLRSLFLPLRPDVRRLSRKMTGLTRVEFLDDAKRLESVQHLGAQPFTFFLDYEEGAAYPKTAMRAKGLVATRPDEIAGRRPFDAIMSYTDGRLMRKAQLSNGVITKSSFYVYQHGDLLPCAKYVFRGDRPELGDERQVEENAEYIAKFELNREGREVRGVLVRTVNGKKERLAVEYEYNKKDVMDEFPVCASFANLLEPSPTVVKKLVEGRRKRRDSPTEWTSIRVVFHPNSPQLAHCELISKDGKLYRSEISARGTGNRYKTFEVLDGGARRSVETPLIVADDPWMLLKATEECSSIFLDNPLAPMPLLRRATSFFSSSKKRKYYRSPLSTVESRILLWREWRQGRLEGIFAKMWDEAILRDEPLLASYWFSRGIGRTATAAAEIGRRHFDVAAAIEIDNTHPDLRSHLLLHFTDLLIFAEGGAAQEVDHDDVGDVIRSNHFARTRALEVAGIDSGTWPADGGGVANCRRDLIDRATGLRWHMFSEVGTPMKVILYQAERNVQQLVLTPLWGADLGGPSEHILSRVPFGLLEGRRWITTTDAIRKYFFPLLRIFVRACCVRSPSSAEVELFTSAFVNMYHYFQAFDWVATWSSDLVINEWQLLWLTHAQELMKSDDASLAAEKPTPEDVDMLRELCVHLLTPLAVPLPQLPVYHCSHHGLQALQAVIAKQLFGSGVVIWDHGILWRERVKALAEARAFPLFVRNGLVGLSRIGVRIIYHNADMVTACTNVSNPIWERKLGGRHKFSAEDSTMLHKMSPIVNGMEVDRFTPHHEQEAKRPTAVMLSHVYDLKDVKNAIRAAVIIVKRFRVAEYQLLVYGALDKDADYVEECRDLIAANGVSDNVRLCGLGEAARVLGQGWLFVNSSKSEGLPLALGEAGLAGLPVVCTDVGGTKEVISENGVAHGRLIPAQNALALARAQLEVFCMLGNLEALVDDAAAPLLSAASGDIHKGLQLEDFAPLRPNGPSLLARMYEMTRKRRALGMRYRAFVKAHFTMDAYLQKHKQQIFLSCMRAHERIAQLVHLSESDGELSSSAMRVRHMLLDEEAYNILASKSLIGSLFPGYKKPSRAKWMNVVTFTTLKEKAKAKQYAKGSKAKVPRNASGGSAAPRIPSRQSSNLLRKNSSIVIGSQPSLYSPSVVDILEASRTRRQVLVQPGASIVPQKYRIVPAESLVMLYADLRDRAQKLAVSMNDTTLMRRVNQMPATFVRPTYSETDLQPEEELVLRKREEEIDLRGRAIIAQHIDQLEAIAKLDLDAEKIEKLLEGVSLLEKLDLLDEMHAEMNEIDLGEGFNYGAGGGGVVTKYIYVNVGGAAPTGERTTEDIKREIEENTKILFDPDAKEADITAANVNLERLYAEYEKSPEARAEAARKKEERRVRHEEDNKAALARLKSRWTPSRLESDATLAARMRKLPILRLVLMDPEAILKIHRADFQRYGFDGVELEELRAVRANLPPFSAGMKTQQDWADALDARIDEMSGPVVKKEANESSSSPNTEKKDDGEKKSDAAADNVAAGDNNGKPAPPPPPPSAAKSGPPPPPPAKRNGISLKAKAAAAPLDAAQLQAELAAFVNGKKLKKAAKPAAAAAKKNEAGEKKEKERKDLGEPDAAPSST